MIEITVSREDLHEARNEGTVIVLTGTDFETGERVTFAGDARPMVDLVDGIAFYGEAMAKVEPWQILEAAGMTDFNSWDVESAAEMWDYHEVLGPATRTLLNLYNWTNRNSDGWAYWNPPHRAARKLMELIAGDPGQPRTATRPDATPEKLKAALTPVKAFRTRRQASFEIVDHLPTEQEKLTKAYMFSRGEFEAADEARKFAEYRLYRAEQALKEAGYAIPASAS